MNRRKISASVFQRSSVTLLLLAAAPTAFGDMVNIGTIDQNGTGFGALTYVLSMHAVGDADLPAGGEQGCAGWTGKAVFTGSGACANYDDALGEEALSGSYLGGNEMNPAQFPHNQTPLLGPGTNKKDAGLGITNASQIAVIFNPDQTGPPHAVTLQDLTMTLWDDSTGAMVWQSGDLLSDGDFFSTSDPGVGQSGFAYALDTAQASQLNTFITGYGGGNFAAGADQLRFGLSAYVTGADGGPDSFFVTTRTVSVPEPPAWLFLGLALVALGARQRRRLAQ